MAQPESGCLQPVGVHKKDQTDTIPNVFPRTVEHRQVLWGHQPFHVVVRLRLACRAGGTDDDLIIIQYLPFYLAKSARACLEHLPTDSIHLWADFKRIFVGNFQGTYVRPGNS